MAAGNMVQQYNDIFQEWLANGAIEAVQRRAEEENCGQ